MNWRERKLPYPGHPNGCPNYGKKIGCPPQSQRLDKVFDFKKTMWLVISRFDLDKWMRKMKQKHPEWSDRQCRCCLYWQGKVRKWLKNGLSVLKKCYYGGTTYTLCPEGMGLNVIRTLKRLGIPIRAKPRDVVYKVAMFGYEKDRLIK